MPTDCSICHGAGHVRDSEGNWRRCVCKDPTKQSKPVESAVHIPTKSNVRSAAVLLKSLRATLATYDKRLRPPQVEIDLQAAHDGEKQNAVILLTKLKCLFEDALIQAQRVIRD